MKTGGGSGSFVIPANYTPGDELTVVDGLTVSFSAGDLVGGDTFTVDLTPQSREEPPDQGVRIAFSDAGTLTVGDRFTIEASRYGGNQDTIQINIGQSAQIELNISGDRVFGAAGDTGNNLFDILARLKQALEQNNQGGVQACLENLNTIQVRHTGNMADIGSRLNRLEVSKNILSDADANNLTRLSGIEDLDLTKALTELNSKQIVFQAALYSTMQVTRATILDYVR